MSALYAEHILNDNISSETFLFFLHRNIGNTTTVCRVRKTENKNIILNECHAAAREADNNPAAQAAARTCGQVAATIHAPTHSLGLALYGALSVAYDTLGVDVTWDKLLEVAAIECGKMESALLAIAVENESTPAKINWRC